MYKSVTAGVFVGSTRILRNDENVEAISLYMYTLGHWKRPDVHMGFLHRELCHRESIIIIMIRRIIIIRRILSLVQG